MSDWHLDLYLATHGCDTYASLWLAVWALGGYS